LLDASGVRLECPGSRPSNFPMYSATEYAPSEVPSYEEAVAEIDFFLDTPDEFHKISEFKSVWLRETAAPMRWAYLAHKHGSTKEALALCEEVGDDAWRLAGKRWLERRFAAQQTTGETR
jgi:hypothetical protein